MSEIRILHLSDLHYDSLKPKDTQIIIDALWKDLDNFKDIDFILFSGDLVKAGDNKEDFEKTFQIFIAPLLKKTKRNVNDFFIAPGNHDIQRSKIDDIIEEGLKAKLSDRDSVNAFLDQEKEDCFKHIERLDNFSEFKRRFETEYTVNSNKLFSTHVVKKNNIKIGIACLNSGWRATGIANRHDYGKLLIGERQIDAALNDIKDCDIKIALYHHPLDWLMAYDKSDAKSILSGKFDLIFCGHLHDANLELVQTFTNKTVLIQGGCLYKGRSYYNGYSVLCFDSRNGEGTIHLRSYFDDRRAFDKAINKCKNGEMPISIKREKFDKKVKKKEEEITAKNYNKGGSNINVKTGKDGRNATVTPTIEVNNDIGKYEHSGFEITVDKSEKVKYIKLSLDSDVEITPVDDKGKCVPVSSIIIRSNKTIIKTPASTSHWKLKILRVHRSNTDPTGTTSSPSDDECGDGFIDWLKGQTNNMDEETKKIVQDAKRNIVLKIEEEN
jgi:predicted MPP superfamily phosphohydrolase